MNIIICGAGEVGRHAAEVLGADGHNITIIDRSSAKLAALEEVMDVRNLLGEATHAEVLSEAGCEDADLFIAATNVDEINLLSASIASAMGAQRTIARVHHSTYFEQHGLDYAHHLGIDHLVCPEHTTAVAIAQTLRSPGALAVERFARGSIELQQLAVSADASAAGQQLLDLRMPPSTRLAMIQRNGHSFVPGAQTSIEHGDVVTLIGDVTGIDKARKLFHAASDRRKSVLIVGGTSLGVWVCRALNSRAFSVRLIEGDADRAEELAGKLEWVTVLRADANDAQVLNDERIDQCDAFVALTDDDEYNVLLAARAKSMGVANAIAVQQRSTYLHLLEHIGIDRAFSPRVTAVQQIQNLLEVGPLRKLASLEVGVAEVFEIRVPAGSNGIIGKKLKEAKFPAGSMVAAVQRGENVFVPGGDDAIAEGDTVIVIGPEDAEKELRKIFSLK